jgi:protein-tyrosine phosphatase
MTARCAHFMPKPSALTVPLDGSAGCHDGRLSAWPEQETEMFRRVDLPAYIPGKLLLHSMPGRFETLEKVWAHVKREAIGAIVCLNEPHEIRLKSRHYAEALERGAVPCAVLPFEIREGGVPEDRSAFWALANDVAARLRRGEGVLVHCAGGVGRTAMLAVSVLLALGQTIAEAESAISQAGSIVETMAQIEMLSWCADQCIKRET